jgi:hypothetical protein
MAKRRKRHTLPKQNPPNGMDYVEYEYRRRNRKEYKEVKGQFTKVRGEFVADLANLHTDELRAWGIRENEIAGMREGMVPEGFSVHHIKPLDSTGGTNERHNLILIPQKPYHDDIHAYLSPQIGGLHISRSRTVKLPMPKGPIYQPEPEALAAYAAARQADWRARKAEQRAGMQVIEGGREGPAAASDMDRAGPAAEAVPPLAPQRRFA